MAADRNSNINNDAGQTILDRMVMSFMSEPGGAGFLEDCMSFDPDLVDRVPLRYRIIALGFARGYGLQELNDKLREAGCSSLYARSLWEASLIYAFSNKLEYEEWKDLQTVCDSIRQEQALEDRYFRDRKVTFRDLRSYVEENSDISSYQISTQHLTKGIDSRLRETALGKGELRDFLVHNIESFSPVREKTRYYFCKYMYYYLESCRRRYLAERGADGEGSIDELAVFKGLTKLKRKKMNDDEVIRTLDEAAISFGAIFDAFNYYFFDYVSLDWMEVLLEYYGDIESIPDNDRRRLANSLRNYDRKKYRGMTDDEILSSKQEELDAREAELDEIYSLDGTDKGYQRNRAGENAVRKYVKGGLDIDRTTLICFLIFFGNKSQLPDELRISRERLTDILTECGFAGLREEDGFDNFIIRFLESDEPVDLLMEEVTDYALDEENFFLYRMYLASRSASRDIDDITWAKNQKN